MIDYFWVGAIDRFESIYSVLCRFALVNSLSGQAITGLFKSQLRARKGFAYGLEHLGSVNSIETERILGLTQTQIIEMFLVPSYTFTALLCPYLRFCPICMGGRKHYAAFQWERLTYCPFHSVRLRTACDNCGSSTLYDWSSELFDSPFCCTQCKLPLDALKGRAGFFDVHTFSRSRSINSIYEKLRGMPSQKHENDHPAEVYFNSSFVVFCPVNDLSEHWYDMADLPLQGLSLDNINWRNSSGYIQIIGSSKILSPVNTRDAFDRSRLISDLLSCLKSILRNLRRILRREQSRSVRAGLYPYEKKLLCRRKKAYSLLLECWCGKSLKGQYTYEGMRQTIEVWLNSQSGEACEPRCFLAVTPWLITHLFCSQVVDSIATVSQLVDSPSELLSGFSMNLAVVKQKPLWYVALKPAPSVVSFRVIHHYQFPSSLWASCV